MTGVVELTDLSTEALKAKALRALNNLPPFSPILNRLMAMLAGEDVSFAKLGDLIEKDTVVAGNLLHLVNSALYGRRGTVNSVRHAVSILGVDKLRNAVLGMSLTRMWSKVKVPGSWSSPRFDLHSASVAILSDLLAQKLPVDYPEGAFVAGLLHDLGQLLIATSLPEHFERIDPADRIASEREILGFTHPELSSEALAAWNLPAAIQIAVLYHHDPESDGSASAGTLPLSQIVWAANHYANASGVSIAKCSDASDPAVIQTLGLRAEQVQQLTAEFQSECDVMMHYFRPN